MLNHKLLSKNAKASLNAKERDDMKCARMYETPEDIIHCPVLCFESYMQKIAQIPNDHLFPKPYKNDSQGLRQQRWFTHKLTVGKNKIDYLMRNLSSDLHLSKNYTNHSIRVTHITVLKENGFSNSEIASNKGHKNPEYRKILTETKGCGFCKYVFGFVKGSEWKPQSCVKEHRKSRSKSKNRTENRNPQP